MNLKTTISLLDVKLICYSIIYSIYHLAKQWQNHNKNGRGSELGLEYKNGPNLA